LRDWIQDVRYGLRTLRRAPAFSVAAALTIALGIGANATLFGVVSAVMLQPLPFKDSERLVRIFESNPSRGWPLFSTSYPNYIDWVRELRSFDPLAASRSMTLTLTGVSEPERIGGRVVTASFFSMLSAIPARGRALSPEDEKSGAPAVVVMSDGLWKRRFASDPAIVGKTLVLNDVPRTVVGVLPTDFTWLPGADLFVPMDIVPDSNRGNHVLAVFGRLRPGVSIEQARAEMDALARRLATEHADTNTGWGVRLMSFYDWIVDEDLRRALLVLLGAVSLLLLVACANVASLLLARAADRRREIAVRFALGAGRLRIVRQLIVETGLLCGVGAVVGLLLGYWGIELLRAIDPGNIPRLDEVSINRWTVLYALVLCLLATLFSGVAPALQMSRADASESLKDAGRGGASHAGRRSLRGPLVAGQIALSLVLLAGAGLLVRSFWRLASVDTGFDSRDLLAVQVDLPTARYKTNKQFALFFESFLEKTRQIPGVRAAAASSILPFEGGGTASEITIEGRSAEPDGSLPSADWRTISPGFFQLLQVPIRAGRDFTSRDGVPGSPGVVIVSETMARRFWPGMDPIGRRVRPGRSQVWQTVVGVAADLHHLSLDSDPAPMVYYPYDGSWNPMSVALRISGDPATIAPAIRRAASSIDPMLPVANVRRVSDMVAGTLGPRRFNATLLAVFAGIALVLASVGLYGAISYAVARRTHEIGVRMALGAGPRDIVRMVIGEGMRLVAIGLAAGLAAAAALTWTLSSLLFGVSAGDPATFTAITALLVAVAFVATYVPARRAARVDPMLAIRCE
jgi:putative ABC transport system permease protein